MVPLKLFQRLLGNMASAAAVTPLGLLHMRPLQHWLHSRVPRWAWRHGTLRVGITQQCRRSLSPWTDLAFLRAAAPLEQVSRHTVVTTDACSTGWGATCNEQAASGLWTGPRLLWHINCLELWAVHLALRQFRPLLLGKHVLVRTDNTAAVLYINRLGGIRSHRMSQLARHLLLWSHTQFTACCSHPGQFNRAADASRREEPRRCTICVVLSFLQERLERRLSPSTLKVYVAAIAAHHDAVDGRFLGKHDLIVRFLKGARRMNPSRPPLVPSWDLSIVLAGLQRGPFEPLDSVELKFLSLKTALLTMSIKRVGDLQAFSVSEECLVFGPVYSHIILRPRSGYVPKVPTTPFRDQVVNLQALPSEEADPALALLCPVRALRIYVDRTRSVRSSDQLFVCHGGQQKGKAVSKQRLAHWIVEAVALVYQSQGEPCPLGVRAHSTRCVAPSHALAHGASLADICRAAGWATPNTFARFYNLRVKPVSSRVLGK